MFAKVFNLASAWQIDNYLMSFFKREEMGTS